MFNHYVICFVNRKNGESKEYYFSCNSDELYKRAKELRKRFFEDDEIIDMHIYKRQKIMFNGEY